MTRKDYELIARAFAASKPTDNGVTTIMRETPLGGWRLAVTAIAASLAADNPRFDRERFLAACGVS